MSQDFPRGSISSIWLESNELGLVGEPAEEWEWYRKNLIGTSIKLVDRMDELKWTGGDSSGQISVKNVYLALSKKLWKFKTRRWRRKLWKWDYPLKIKKLSSLLTKNKILTWKNLQKRGWKGPGLCYLCKGMRELGKHLFVNCPFTVVVWEKVNIALKLTFGWSGNSVIECFENWSKHNYIFQALPTYICWYLWLDRNKTIFESVTPSIQRIMYLSLGALGTHWKNKKVSSPRLPSTKFPVDKVIVWFDGAAQQNGELNGAGGVIMINEKTEYRWTLNCGSGTNSKA